MALTRIKSGNILDKQVASVDLADGSVTFEKIRVPDTALPGYVLTTDGTGELLWAPPQTTSIGNLDDVDLTGLGTGDVLQWDGANFVPATVGGVAPPPSNKTFVVNTNVERDALVAAEGDQAFVRTGPDGEYKMYVYDAGWVLLTTADSARSDANTAEAIVAFNTGSPVLIGNISNDTRITNVTIEVTVPFDGTPTLSVGDTADNSRLMDDDLFDLSDTGTYVANPDYVYDGTEIPGTIDTDIFAYFNFTGSTQGEARIIVTHV